MREVVIVDSVRTGLAKSFRGKFNMTRPDDMAAHCVNALLSRNDLDPKLVEDCIVGAGSNEGAQGYNIGRNVAVLSNLGIQCAGMTLNRFCSSGLQSIAIAANQIASGCSDIIVAGGVESITMTAKSRNSDNLFNPILQERVPGLYHSMGQTAEMVARRYNVTREQQDQYSLQSQQRTARAQAEGLFQDEIVPMNVRYFTEDKATGERTEHEGVVDRDDCNRPDTTLENLSSLKPVFAVPRLLQARGLQVSDIDLWELNEAFASQCLYCRDTLGIDNEKFNVNGGSISIGHPFGMTGSRTAGHLIRELQRRNQRYGVVTMCVGGGMGASGLFEAVR
jgi:acetyl-CoA acyltransferase